MTDLAGQGFSVLFNAAALALSKIRGPQRVKLDTFEVDCTLSESIVLQADVTEFEVETGANISDHRRTRPVEFSIAGLVSDTRLESDLVKEAVQLAAGPLGLGLDALGVAKAIAAGDATITRDAFDKLVGLFEHGGAFGNPSLSGPVDLSADFGFTIVTKRTMLENMVVKELRFQRDRGTGDALPFFATFREIRTVDTASVTIVRAFAQQPNHLGHLSPATASQATTDKALGQLEKFFGFTRDDPDYEAYLKRNGGGPK